MIEFLLTVAIICNVATFLFCCWIARRQETIRKSLLKQKVLNQAQAMFNTSQSEMNHAIFSEVIKLKGSGVDFGMRH